MGECMSNLEDREVVHKCMQQNMQLRLILEGWMLFPNMLWNMILRTLGTFQSYGRCHEESYEPVEVCELWENLRRNFGALEDF